MNHLIVIMHFLSICSGIMLIALVNYIYPVKSPVIKHALLADFFYTVFLLFDTIDLYARKNISDDIGFINFILDFGQFIIPIVGAYFIFLMTCDLLDIQFADKSKRLCNRILFSLLLFLTIMYCIGQFQTIVGHYLLTGTTILLYLLLAYCYIIFFINSGKIKADIRKLVMSCLIVGLIFTPGTFLANLIDGLPVYIYKFPYWPVMYSLINIIGIIFIPKNHSGEKDKPEAFGNSSNISLQISTCIYEQFASDYGITERELEIARCIADGYSNPEISEKLYISTNTVKNHIYNIYRKVGIKNRYELISILSQMQNSGETTNAVK